MANILDLIKKLCPNGVEYKKLGEVCEFKRGKNLKRDPINYGNYPVISGGLKPAFYANVFNCSGESILISGSGVNAGFVSYWNQDIFVADSFYIKTSNLNTKYVYYFLKKNQDRIFNLKKGAGIPHVYPKDVELIPIPIPPLSIQEEIVKILDKFTSLTTELTARKKQYEHYRNSLLTLDDSVERKKLGEVCEVSHVKSLPRKMYDTIGSFPIIDQSMKDIAGYSSNSDIVVEEGEYIFFGDHTRIVKYINFRFVLGESGSKIFKVNSNKIITKYVFYAFKNLKIPNRGYNRHWSIVKNFPIPIPTLEIQKEIVKKLDAFSELINILKKGQ